MDEDLFSALSREALYNPGCALVYILSCPLCRLTHTQTHTLSPQPGMSLQGNDTNDIVVATPAETSFIDITMTTPETTITPDAEQHHPLQQQQVDPRTAATRQKVVDIVDHQFDLEILLRHAEGASIAQELAKAERMLEDLRHAILSGTSNATLLLFFSFSLWKVFIRVISRLTRIFLFFLCGYE